MKERTKLGIQAPKHIAILRALQLGDMLCSVPAFRALRSAYPQSQITLLGLPWAASFVERFNHYIDDFLELPGYPGLPERKLDARRLPKFFEEVQWLDFDLMLQMQGSGVITNPLVSMLGARRSAGFFIPGQYCPDEELFLPYPVYEHEIEVHLRLMDFLGIPREGEHLEFPLHENDWHEFHGLQQNYGLPAGGFACIHPGSRAPERRWPVKHFAAVADHLADSGLQIVLSGTTSEKHLSEAVAQRMKNPAINLAGRTSLGGLGVMLAQSRLLVSNDTGVSHMAAALKVPSVILFTASDPNRWAPLDRQLHRAVAWASAAIPQVVLDEVESLLSEEKAYVS
jgi:ADP-heptose:LPS heptosyltransferase